MTVPIRQISLSEFAQLLHAYRQNVPSAGIDCIHLHCTDTPNHASWRGLDSVEAMRRYHIEKGWSEIAQHLTIDPYGSLWSGRPWTRAPASATGFNSGKQTPFMIEMVGRFDERGDVFAGSQAIAAGQVIALIGQVILGRRGKDWKSFVVPHAWMNQVGKTCPGHALWQNTSNTRADASKPSGGEVPDSWTMPADFTSQLDNPLFDALIGSIGVKPSALRLAILRNDPLIVPTRDLVSDEGGGPPENSADAERINVFAREALLRGRGRSIASREVTGDDALFKRHVIALENGLFAEDGEYQTRPEDIDKHVFGEGFSDYRQGLGDATPRLLFWAHGGLNDEASALDRVRQWVPFWLANGIYPVYFVWRTGAGETVEQLLKALADRLLGARGIGDVIKEGWDDTVERLAEKPGRLLWNGMKESAVRASNQQLERGQTGGAYRFCERLLQFTSKTPNVELHAVGHSAGSIFLAQLLGAFKSLQGKGAGSNFTTWNFLAPALRSDLFEALVVPDVGTLVEKLSVFTMDDTRERDDDCMHVYGKSLLYLVSRAFEDEEPTALVGMARFVPDPNPLDAEQPHLVDFKAKPVAGKQVPSREVACYVSALRNDSLGLTCSHSHGGFDEDPATLDTLVRIINNTGGKWPSSSKLPIGFLPQSATEYLAKNPARATSARLDRAREAAYWLERSLPSAAPTASTAVGTPSRMPGLVVPATRRLALCMGINVYPGAPLQGCVADSDVWADALAGLGFRVTKLRDADASLAAMRSAIAGLVDSARPGDSLVFQYAGHGSQLEDDDGDEDDGYDEALVPVDYETAGFLIDDDLYAITQRLPANTSLTLFMDCCHSGTNSRFAPPLGTRSGGSARARFLYPTAASLDAHMRNRANAPATLAPRGAGAKPSPRVVHFAACRDHEYAMEHEGHGDFTTVAARLLRQPASARLRPEEYMRRVLQDFPADGSQRPQLLIDADSLASSNLLFSLVP